MNKFNSLIVISSRDIGKIYVLKLFVNQAVKTKNLILTSYMFLMKLLCYMNKKSRQTFKYLGNKKNF